MKPTKTSQAILSASTAKGKRSGRWTQAESALFEELIELYGKNWKKIHSHIRGRTLCQIRSHAQKFFERIGPIRAKQFERKAKILEALETLENEKLLQRQVSSKRAKEEQKSLQAIVKQEEKSVADKDKARVQSGVKNGSGELSGREYIKEQFEEQADRRVQAPLSSEPLVMSPPITQANECMYAPIYWYPNHFAINGLGNPCNVYSQQYL